MNSDVNVFQKLQVDLIPNDLVPCGDETRILLFARNDREKEDWYRRFKSASLGNVNDQENNINGIVTLIEEEKLSTLRQNMMIGMETDDDKTTDNNEELTKSPKSSKTNDTVETKESKVENRSNSIFEGLLITACATRGPTDYLRFMSKFQVSVIFFLSISIIFFSSIVS